MSKRNIVHVEIPAVNVEGAGKFYQDLFGWKMQHMPEMNYTMWEAGDGDEYGGFPQVSEENPAGQVLIYIASDDIDADLKKVVQLGGKVLHPKTEIPGMGWYGVFQDTTGNVLAVYTGMNPANN
jgi:predicted enzyme related to lactoylglutathione lyase